MRFVLIVLLLAGCATPQEETAKMVETYGTMCERIGYAKDTDKWRDCIVSFASKQGVTVSMPLR